VAAVVQVFALEHAVQLGHATGVPAVPLTNAKLAAAVVQVAAGLQTLHPVTHAVGAVEPAAIKYPVKAAEQLVGVEQV